MLLPGTDDSDQAKDDNHDTCKDEHSVVILQFWLVEVLARNGNEERTDDDHHIGDDENVFEDGEDGVETEVVCHVGFDQRAIRDKATEQQATTKTATRKRVSATCDVTRTPNATRNVFLGTRQHEHCLPLGIRKWKNTLLVESF